MSQSGERWGGGWLASSLQLMADVSTFGLWVLQGMPQELDPSRALKEEILTRRRESPSGSLRRRCDASPARTPMLHRSAANVLCGHRTKGGGDYRPLHFGHTVETDIAETMEEIQMLLVRERLRNFRTGEFLDMLGPSDEGGEERFESPRTSPRGEGGDGLGGDDSSEERGRRNADGGKFFSPEGTPRKEMGLHVSIAKVGMTPRRRGGGRYMGDSDASEDEIAGTKQPVGGKSKSKMELSSTDDDGSMPTSRPGSFAARKGLSTRAGGSSGEEGGGAGANREERRSLQSKIRHRRYDDVVAMLDRGIPTETRDEFGNTLLMLAAQVAPRENGCFQTCRVACRRAGTKFAYSARTKRITRTRTPPLPPQSPHPGRRGSLRPSHAALFAVRRGSPPMRARS